MSSEAVSPRLVAVASCSALRDFRYGGDLLCPVAFTLVRRTTAAEDEAEEAAVPSVRCLWSLAVFLSMRSPLAVHNEQ